MTMKKIRKQLMGVLLLLAAMAPQCAAAQAFDGDMDEKIHVGYLGMEGVSGMEVEFLSGLSDYFSYGGFARYVFDKDVKERLSCFDLGGSAYFHWDELLNLPDRLDIHTGLQISYQSGGVAIGVRYNFSERLGFYARAQKGLFDVFRSKEFDHPFSGRKFSFSVGLTYSL